jgi:hypothetical protein
MRILGRALVLFWLPAAVCGIAWTADTPSGGDPAKAAFARLKGLAGEWQGTPSPKDGPPLRVVYRVTGAGSALVETLFPETDHEMVTVYYMNGDALALTHYCAAGNQPHMRLDARASAPDRLVFAFDGGTNLDPAVDNHMHSVVMTFKDADHVEAEWASYQKGQPEGTHRFVLERVRTATK